MKEMQRYISQLNEAQQAPVLQKDGPMIVIAGAGSGKTRVLTERVRYILDKTKKEELVKKLIDLKRKCE